MWHPVRRDNIPRVSGGAFAGSASADMTLAPVVTTGPIVANIDASGASVETGDKLLVLFVVAAACCFLLPLLPYAVNSWGYYGPGRWIIPAGVAGGMVWTIWGHR